MRGITSVRGDLARRAANIRAISDAQEECVARINELAITPCMPLFIKRCFGKREIYMASVTGGGKRGFRPRRRKSRRVCREPIDLSIAPS